MNSEQTKQVASPNHEVAALAGKIIRAYNDGKTLKLSKPDVNILYGMLRRSTIDKI